MCKMLKKNMREPGKKWTDNRSGNVLRELRDFTKETYKNEIMD